MDLSLSQDQLALQEAFAAFLAKELPPERVRAAEPLGFDRALWESIAEMGALAIGTADGGAELVQLGGLCEELGRRLAPVPLVDGLVSSRPLWRTRTAQGAGTMDVVEDWIERTHTECRGVVGATARGGWCGPPGARRRDRRRRDRHGRRRPGPVGAGCRGTPAASQPGVRTDR